MKLFCDNQAAYHIEVDCHFIRKKIQAKEIETPFVRSEDQLAGILTKGWSRCHLKLMQVSWD
jgi:hypothetical protein